MKFLKCDLTNVGLFGDVHAALQNLKNVLNLLNVGERNKIVSLGDLWDRGNEPNEVIDIIHDLYTQGKLIPVMGNHDWKFVRYFTEKNVILGNQQTATVGLLKDKSIEKLLDLYKDEIVCVYDPIMKIFVSHGPGGRPQRILYKNYDSEKITMGGQANMTFEEFLAKDYHVVAKKHVSTLLYGITNGDKTAEGLPIRLPIVVDATDDLDGWKYIYGHIHGGAFYVEANKTCICLDFCSPTGPIGGCIVNNTQEDITLVV
jgi:predicted phosphodiesterase